jgi:hypothetical protein
MAARALDVQEFKFFMISLTIQQELALYERQAGAGVATMAR